MNNTPFTLEYKQFKGSRYDLLNHSIYVETADNADIIANTFIVVHGACATGRYMNLISEEIINTIPNSRVIVIDLPFHGESTADVDVSGQTIFNYLEVVHELYKHLAHNGKLVGKINWIGWSMGGSLGLLMNIKYGLIDNLNLVCSSHIWNGVVNLLNTQGFGEKEFIKTAFQGVLAHGTKPYKPDVVGHFMNAYNEITAKPEVMLNDFKCIIPSIYNLTNDLSRVSSKTLIFAGSQDFLATQETQMELLNSISGSTYVTIVDTHELVLNNDSVEKLVGHIKLNSN